MKLNKKLVCSLVAVVALASFGAPQIKQVIKLIGVGAAVQKFAPDINKAINKLTKHENTEEKFTKVVPILRIGIGAGGSAVGAAQVKGTRQQVDKVRSVFQPTTKLFGEIEVRALIPVANKTISDKPEVVDGVGVSGIVDLRL